MFHGAAQDSGHDPSSAVKMRLGVRMFLLYGLVYAGFVVINVVRPTLMEVRLLFGLNLATVYGFGLICSALLLALVYNRKCTRYEREAERAAASEEDAS